MKFIQSKCKICGRSATAQFDDDAPQEAVDKWLPLLTCNPCYDTHTKRRRSEEAIVNLCFAYARSPQKGKIVAETRNSLIEATKDYAEAVQETYKAPAVIWSEAFADTLIERPSQYPKILGEYRAEVRRTCRQQA